jgi:hypothetical protein
MANSVVIEVEARVGDAIAQMTLTAGAVRLLADEVDNAGSKVGTENDGRTLSGRLSRLQGTLSNIGDRGPLGKVIRGFGNLASAMLEPLDLGLKFAENFERIGTVGQSLLAVLVSLPVAFVGLAAAVAAVTFAATALADILGTLVAIAADFVAPLSLVAGLLGGLGLAFGIAAKRAADGGGKLSEFSQKLDMLKSMFGRTSDILAHAFLPYLLELAGAAQQALNFLDKIARLPLRQAFHAIDTQGMHMLRQFVDRVAEVLGRPIRLAFKVAFDDKNFAGMVQDWWHRFTGFLFGETESHPIKLHKKTIGFESHAVEGIFQPLIDWFNRHHFTQQGIQIGRQILNGVLDSGMRQRIVNFIVQVLRDSARRGGRAFLATLNQPMGPMLLALVRRTWNSVDQIVNDAGHRARQAIISAMQSAWNSVLGFVSNIWNEIVDFITHPISINIDWPSPPSWLGNLNPFGGGGSSVPSRGGSGGSSNPTFAIASARPSALGHVTVVQHFHGIDTHTLQGRRQLGQITSRAVEQRWVRSGQ